jgi:hypothetical protein
MITDNLIPAEDIRPVEALQVIYLDWLNNFLTVDRFAEYYRMTPEAASELIEVCHSAHETIVKRKRWMELVK